MLADWEKCRWPPAARWLEAAPRRRVGERRISGWSGMLHQRFVVMESEDGLVLFDPKAAKERIFYEKLLQPAATAVLETQGLLVPVLLELDPRDLDLVLRERMALAEAGIEVEAVRRKHVQIRTLARLPGGRGSAAVSRGVDG